MGLEQLSVSIVKVGVEKEFEKRARTTERADIGIFMEIKMIKTMMKRRRRILQRYYLQTSTCLFD